MFDLRFFEIYRNGEYLQRLAEGMGVSAALAVIGGVAGLTVACLIAVARHRKLPLLQHAATVYVEVLRNTPLIVQLFFFAFGLPLLLGYSWPFWAHALLTLTINFSAYFSEILRAGLVAVPNEQSEAAQSLGIRDNLIFRKIIFPQAIAATYPSLVSQFIFLFLTTGVIAEIGVTDLTNAGLFIDSRTFRSFEVFITLTVLYLLMAFTFKVVLRGVFQFLFPWRAVR